PGVSGGPGVSGATGPPAELGLGGPDPFGYHFIDSDEPAGPVFTWADLRVDGSDTGLTGDDSVSAAIPLGFQFPFYDERFDSVRIGSNGLLSFTSVSTPYTNQPLPNSNAPENIVAPFWDDLFLTPLSRVVYKRDAGRFRVQYDAVMHYDGTGPDTFQVELNAAGEIDFRYRRLEGNRLSATVGIQDATRTRGLLVSFNAPYLHDDLAVHIDAVPQWLTATPGRGRLGPGQSSQVTVGIDAGRLPGGAYEGSILVLSNDPEVPVREHPVSLRVTDAPAIAVTPPIVDFGTVFAGFASQQPITLHNTGTERLSVASAGAGAPAVTAIGAPTSIEPGGTADLTVIWSPALPATLDATLTIVSDAANQPALVVPLHGAAITPPSIGVTPAAFVETVTSGNAITRTLALTNSGPAALDFRVRALAGPAGVSAGSSAAVFERLDDSPQPVTCLAGDADAGLVYCQETLGTGFWRHRLSGGTWEALAPAPFGAGEEAGAALLDGRLYVSYAGRNSLIAVYDVAARTWSTLAHPLGLGSAAVASDGSGALYFVGATTFVRYDPIAATLVALPAPPFSFGFRGGLRYFEGSLYGHAGGGSTGFARYDLAAGSWETLAPIPGGAGLGATIDPYSREYAATASGGRGVARYAFEARSWSVTAVPLFATGDGGLAWMPSPAPGLVITQGRDGRRCVRLSTAPGFVTLDASTGRVPGTGTIGIAVRLDSAGLSAGDHRAALLVESNDPRAPAVTVPVSLTVLGAPDLRLLGDTVTVESTRPYVGAGAVTTHALTLAEPPGDGGTLTLLAEGDYGDAGERAAIRIEGIDLGSAGGAASDCAAASASFALSDALLATLAADGRLDVEVRNGPDVGDLCGLNRHTVRLAYAAPVDRMEFGEVFAGLAGGRAIVLRNQGTAPLTIASITAAPAAFVPAVGGATLLPGESLRLEVLLTPAGPGPIDGTLVIASDDPDRPTIEVPLHGTGVAAPRAEVRPAEVARTLLTNQAAVETITLSNTGSGPLRWSVEGRAAADAPGCVPTRLLATQYESGTLASVDLLTGAVAPLAFGLTGPGVGLDVDARAGVAYLVESDRGAVAAVDLVTGSVRTVAAGFSYPYGLAFDAVGGRLFVSDSAPGTIVEVDPVTGATTTRAGGLAGGADLAMSPDGGTLYVADNIAGRLLKMDTSTGALQTLVFGLGTVAGLALDPAGSRAL
ncbi:MAG TPA: choice-of-anchor D domain-containing protein, partial [Candidatus Polarisedimenticolia bacterium]|nr:choice-of-anchor D domain-containing protein [Candidatus Polarisedimenticolia bacterium]